MANDNPATQEVDRYVGGFDGWRGEKIRALRTAVVEAFPGFTEEWKWETPVWSYNGNVVAACVFKDHVKLNFFKGALLSDFEAMFNSGLDAKKTRAIDFFEHDELKLADIKKLVAAAAALNKK